LASAAILSDTLVVVAYGAFNVANTYTIAQADAAFYQTAVTQMAGKNKIINGDFTINQRAFTSTTTSGTYGFDRFRYVYTGGTATYSAETFTPGAAPVAGYEATNFARLVTTGQSAVGDFCYLFQTIEDVRTFAGQTVTVSFWAKASSGTPNVGISLEQTFGAGGSSLVVVNGGVKAITTSWARYSVTVAVPSVSGKTIGTSSRLAAGLFTSAGTSISGAGYPAVGIQNETIDFWGVQVEAGSVATAFQTATGTIQGELAACQRYYFRTSPISDYGVIGVASLISDTSGRASVALPVTMRVLPTSVDSSTLAIGIPGSSAVAISSVALSNTSLNYPTIAFTFPTNFSANQIVMLTANNSTSAYIGFSAEL
jgi:hypothetical protein